MKNRNKISLSIVAIGLALFSGCGGSDGDAGAGETTTLEKVLEHLDIEPSSATEIVNVVDSLLTDGTLVFGTDELDTFNFTATETGEYTYYLDVPLNYDFDVYVSIAGSVISVSDATSDTNEQGSFTMQRGETGSIDIEFYSGTASAPYVFELAKPSEPTASQYTGTTITDPVITDPVTTGTVLACSSYTQGLCATYTFSDAADALLFSSTCTEVSSCTTTSLVGVCDTGTDNTTGGTGTVQSDLFLYDPSYNSTGAQTICEGLDPVGVWRTNP